MRVGRVRLLLLAIAATIAIVFAANALTDLVLGDRLFGDSGLGFIDAPDVAFLHLAFTGLPFLALAVLGEGRRANWLVSIGLTLVSWGYAVWQVWKDSLTGFAGGANIGLGLIMMAAPVLITGVVIAHSVIAKDRRSS